MVGECRILCGWLLQGRKQGTEVPHVSMYSCRQCRYHNSYTAVYIDTCVASIGVPSVVSSVCNWRVGTKSNNPSAETETAETWLPRTEIEQKENRNRNRTETSDVSVSLSGRTETEQKQKRVSRNRRESRQPLIRW